jgi:nitrite reductase/ring-hydroxylating ferredoxin subunit
VRRVGAVHAVGNVAALGLQLASLAARRRGERGRGIALSLGAGALLGLTGYLGGHLSFARGVGVNQTSFDPGPDDWTDALAAADLVSTQPKTVVIGDTPVLLARVGGSVLAIHDRCSHRGCSLSEGTVTVETVECACHGSRFSLRDGRVERGPATSPQPAFEARERDGRIELRLRPSYE